MLHVRTIVVIRGRFVLCACTCHVYLFELQHARLDCQHGKCLMLLLYSGANTCNSHENTLRCLEKNVLRRVICYLGTWLVLIQLVTCRSWMLYWLRWSLVLVDWLISCYVPTTRKHSKQCCATDDSISQRIRPLNPSRESKGSGSPSWVVASLRGGQGKKTRPKPWPKARVCFFTVLLVYHVTN